MNNTGLYSERSKQITGVININYNEKMNSQSLDTKTGRSR